MKRTPELLSFEHTYKSTKTKLDVTRCPGNIAAKAYLKISSAEGNEVAHIVGFWRDTEVGAVVHVEDTVNEPQESERKLVPRAVGATIAELIRNGVVATLYSDPKLSSSAKEMYAWLGNQQGIAVGPPSDETRMRHVVTKATK